MFAPGSLAMITFRRPQMVLRRGVSACLRKKLSITSPFGLRSRLRSASKVSRWDLPGIALYMRCESNTKSKHPERLGSCRKSAWRYRAGTFKDLVICWAISKAVGYVSTPTTLTHIRTIRLDSDHNPAPKTSHLH